MGNHTDNKSLLRNLSGFLGALLISTAMIYGQNGAAKGKILSSFESPADLQKLKLTNAQVSLTAEHVTEGKSALEVDFTTPGTASIEFLSETSPWDWAAFGAIAVDVYNPAEQEISIGIELRDAASTGLGNYVGGRGNVSPARCGQLLLSDGRQFFARAWHAGRTSHGSGDRAVQWHFGFEPPARGGPRHSLQADVPLPAGVKSVVIDNVRLLPPFNYDGIVDAFGQYTRADWPGKVKNAAGLLAQKQQEEEEIKAHPTRPRSRRVWRLGVRSESCSDWLLWHGETRREMVAGGSRRSSFLFLGNRCDQCSPRTAMPSPLWRAVRRCSPGCLPVMIR